MNHYLFYTTEGYTLDPNLHEIENCQMLGRADGNNKGEALLQLLAENSWIVEHNYDIEAIVACRVIDE